MGWAPASGSATSEDSSKSQERSAAALSLAAMGRITKAVSRVRFRKGDPLRDLHVPRRERLATDEGDDSDALTPSDDYPLFPDTIRDDTTVVDAADLA